MVGLGFRFLAAAVVLAFLSTILVAFSFATGTNGFVWLVPVPTVSIPFLISGMFYWSTIPTMHHR